MIFCLVTVAFPGPKGRVGHPDLTQNIGQTLWVQTCIVHLIRASLRYVNYRDLKKVTSALRPIYTAANADAALSELARFDADWGARYPATVRAWRDAWEHVVPFLSLPEGTAQAPSTPPTRSRACTARSARRSRPAGTSPTSRQPPS